MKRDGFHGEAFDGGEAKEFEVVLGEKRMLPEFEQSLIGAKDGSELTAVVPFPADYHAANLAGKTAEFKIKVHKVLEPKLPPLDDEMAKLFNVKEGGLSALREEVRKNMGRELTHRIRDRLKDAALKKLLELNPIEVPKALVDAEILQSKRAFFERAGMRGEIKPELLAMIPDDRFKEDATRRVQIGLLLTHIISSEKIKADPQKVHDKVTELAAVYDDPDQMIAYVYSHKDQLRQIEAMVFEEQVIDKLLTEATVVEKLVAYAELMELAEQATAA
ncbi:MAG: trigger factor [Burkholderiaceae bacterium]|nr:trigger factor [Burkholderiaceae bacterium]